MGEGAGVLVMESLEHAQKRGANILGEYLGGAITCDAYHMTDPRADGLGVKTCIELALKDSMIERDQVYWVMTLQTQACNMKCFPHVPSASIGMAHKAACQ